MGGGGGGTEAFPNLGSHCEHKDCNQLDFLPFTCEGCRKVFCLEHRTYKSHDCPKEDHKDWVVLVCASCNAAIERKDGEADETVLRRHEASKECDPSKKKKPKCPVSRCKELLTFTNSSACKACGIKVCLKHRFPSDHLCSSRRMGCKEEKLKRMTSRVSNLSIKAC